MESTNGLHPSRRLIHKMRAIINAVTEAGLTVEKLVEPLPTDEFRTVESKSYERLPKQPEFLIIRARSCQSDG
jgi:hypothetical protein